MSEQNSISVIIPSLNEEAHLEDTVNTVESAAARHFDDYELILVNDGSTDGTAEVAEGIKRRHRNIIVIHHETPRSLGGCFRSGLARASMYYVTRINGKFDTTPEALDIIWTLKGKADMIVPFPLNERERHWSRRFISHLFIRALNTLFGQQISYYNHYVLHRRADLQGLQIRTDSYAFQAEILLKLIRTGHSFVEVGHWDKLDNEGATKAFKPRNLWGVAVFFWWIIYDLHLSRRYRRGASRVAD